MISAILSALTGPLAQPIITAQPKDIDLEPHRAAIFSVAAHGAPPISFQWWHDGAIVAQATNSSLRLTNVEPIVNGEYLVVVSDVSGSATSQIARLKVFVPSPHGFDHLTARSGESAILTLTGETTAFFAGYWDLYPVEVSGNLTNWYPLVTLQRANRMLAPLTFADAGAAAFSHRFYRTPTNHFITPFPQPAGPYAVGTFSRVVSDPARANAYRYSRRTNVFMLTCWYPAEPQAGRFPSAAWDHRVAGDSSRYSEFSEDASWASVVPQFKGHALSEAPILSGTTRYPIILYSHGYTCHRKINCHDAEELASHGFVVVGVDHEDCWGTEFPDGRYLKSAHNAGSFTSGLQLTESRVKDLVWAIEELRSMDANDPFLAGRLDLDALGTLGMSFGGSATANLCRTNAVIKCAAFLDCAFHFEFNADLKQNGIQKPFPAAYSDAFRTVIRGETGQCSDMSRTVFRWKSDSVPADSGQF